MSTRETAVAGQFYPLKASEIQATLKKYNEILDAYFKTHPKVSQLKPRAVIVPHAGYVYSGFTANVALRLLNQNEIKRIVVIGPSHRVGFKGTSIAEYDDYSTPLGKIQIDRDLIKKLKEKFALTFVPEAHHEHSTEVQMPIIKNYAPEISIVELVYGDEKPQNLAKVIEYVLEQPQTAVVISTDLSHYYDINKANKLDAICIDAVLNLEVSTLHQGCEACGKIGVEAMLIAAKSKGLFPKLLDYRTSAEASADKSSVVGYMSVAFTDEEPTEEREAKVLLELARASIAKAVGVPYKYDEEITLKENPWLQEKGAAFVTLTTKGDQLRGCIGSLVAHRKLYNDVIENAKNAAIHDPRFVALSEEEFNDIDVEVSILTPALPVEYSSIEDLKSKIKVGIDGVVLKYGKYQATFLPQVWEQLPSFELFFAHLCKKAGMGEACLSEKPDISLYQVKKYKENRP